MNKECKCCEDIHWMTKCSGKHGHLYNCPMNSNELEYKHSLIPKWFLWIFRFFNGTLKTHDTK